jgi:CheY-like chemotaxis protein
MLGYQVAEAGDGGHALRVLDEAPADLVITDLEMPEVDGIELLGRLRADGRWRTTPVIVLTTRGSESDRRRAVAAGADAYLVKTEFSEAALREALHRHLGAS